MTNPLIDRAIASLHGEVGTFTDDAGHQWLVQRWRVWCCLDYTRGRIQGDTSTQEAGRELRAEFRELERRGLMFNFHLGAQSYYALRLVDPPVAPTEHGEDDPAPQPRA